ncbi:MAG: DNA internalization-related competence protein ComEC/Rec2 [Phycisphaeraceae bacterium]
MVRLCLVVMAGVMAGTSLPWLHLWLALMLVGSAGVIWMVMRGRERGVRVWAMVTLVFIVSVWAILDLRETASVPLSAYVGRDSQLAKVRGYVIDPAVTGSPTRGAFVRFNYQPPSTRFILRVEEIQADGRWVEAPGDLLVRIDEAEHRIGIGQAIEAAGWLGPINGPANVGEFDYREYLSQDGIVGRLTLRSRGNWRPLEFTTYGFDTRQRLFRHRCAERALSSLRLGMDADSPTMGLLETMLLGRKDSTSSEIRLAFREVGLSHLLSISGAHLGILMAIVWAVARLVVFRPSRSAAIVLAVLALYLMAVPLRVPIVRSGIMAAVFAGCYATGRRPKPMDVLALAAIAVLLWRPKELFSPGFQLSFAAVGGLILFVPRVAEWLWPRPVVMPESVGVGWIIGRWCVDYLAVSLVAFAVVSPLVAYHFMMVNPLAVLLSVMALPVITAVLAVGYFKILAGVLYPSLGVAVSGPLSWLGDTLRGLVNHAADWPGVALFLNWQPTVTWTFGISAWVIAVLSGMFAGRRRALAVSLVILLLWTGVSQFSTRSGWFGRESDTAPAALLTMFSVGDGSCYLLQWSGHTLMFDCGSQQYFDIAQSSILPALKQMGVTRIDTLILSHADMDHFGGALDLADEITIGRVLVPPQLLGEAKAHPGSTTAFLIHGLEQRGLAIQPVSRGWSERASDCTFKVLWPPAGYVSKRANDTSVVLSTHIAGRRILLNGDIQNEAMTALMSMEDLAADITDLPHHGGFVEASPSWLAKVTPAVVLQSCGRSRLYLDRWEDVIDTSQTRRYISARDGMTQIRIDDTGAIETWSLRSNRDIPGG